MSDPNGWQILFVVLASIVVITFVIVDGLKKDAQRKQDERELRKFLARWQGTVKTRTDGRREIHLIVGGTPIAIEYTSRTEDDTEREFTHLNVTCQTPLPRLEIRPQTPVPPLNWLFSLPGNADIQIGVADFDDAYLIQGKGPHQIREFLTAEVRQAIFTVARFDSQGQHDDLHLETYDGWLRLTKHYRVRTDDGLWKFASYAKALVDVIQLQTGIEIVAAGAPVAVQRTQCRVCGDPLRNQVVFCAQCRSPHHQDCWQYIGGCSVYGCGGKASVANQQSAPPKP